MFDPTRHVAWAGWYQTSNTLGGGSFWYRTDCGLSVLKYRPSQLPGRASVISRDGWGEEYMFMFDLRALMTPP
jgi:hypothetical protein